MEEAKKITVVGAGYVGIANACLLSEKHQINIVDTDSKKIKSFLNLEFDYSEKLINEYLKKNYKKFHFSNELSDFFGNSNLYIICLPTNFSQTSKSLDTSLIEKVVQQIHKNDPEIDILIRSTVPVGFTSNLSKKIKKRNLIFFPEFLREGKSLEDSLFPSRIVVGGEKEISEEIFKVFKNIIKNSPECFQMTSAEAESVKLFSNSYLAMRVSFFNELDNFAIKNKLRSKEIIQGVSGDPRIGNYYNNPSFGYGGYCLPKDTKQLLNNFNGIPQKLFKSIIDSNQIRAKFLSKIIMEKNPSSIGVYKLIMKKDSDNMRDSAILKIIKILKKYNLPIHIFDPNITSHKFKGLPVIKDLCEFKSKSSVILCNRLEPEIMDSSDIIFTRDVFGGDS